MTLFSSSIRRSIRIDGYPLILLGVELSSSNECVLQIRISEQLKREIMRAAFEKECTLRAYVLEALKAQGIQIADDDLIDRRKQKRGQ